jgi:hypothetical protein
MTIRQFGVLLFLMVSGTPTILTAQARRPTLHVAALDTVIRQFWRAMAADDSAMVRRLTVGDQPKQAAYLFGTVTPENAELGMPRPVPRLRVCVARVLGARHRIYWSSQLHGPSRVAMRQLAHQSHFSRCRGSLDVVPPNERWSCRARHPHTIGRKQKSPELRCPNRKSYQTSNARSC